MTPFVLRPFFTRLLALVSLLPLSACARASAFHWTDPTPAELSMTSEPKAPGAPAIILSYDEMDDGNSAEVMVHVRIKILTEGGLSAANVRIPSRVVFNDEFDQVFQARTIHSDGSVVAYTRNAQNTVVREDPDTSEKVIALPSAQVGSILEYAYHFASQNSIFTYLIGFYAPTWRVQGAYFTRAAHFNLKVPHSGDADPTRWVAKLPQGVTPRRVKDRVELEVQNVPAIPDEEFMPPRSSVVYTVRFFYWSKPADRYWGETGDRVDSVWSDFYRPRKAVAAAVNDLLKPTAAVPLTDEQKLRKLYAAVQGFENTDLTRQHSAREDKQSGLDQPKNSDDIWNRKVGNSQELTLLFIALARAAGYNAYPMAVASRNHAVFDQNVLSWSQLDSMVAIVVVNGKEHFFDPGTRLCPFGMMAPWHSDVIGVSSEGKLMKIRSTPEESFANFRTERRAVLTLEANGSVKGSAVIAWVGTAGLALRREAVQEDVHAVEASIQEDIQKQLPSGVESKLVSLKGLPDGEAPLIAEFSLTGTLGMATQKRLLIPAQFFASTAKPLLSAESRTAPLVFPEARSLRDQVEIRLAPQVSVETLPEAQTLSVSTDTAYNATAQPSPKNAQVLIAQRIFILKRMEWTPAEYPALHRYFGQVAQHDQDQIVLHVNGVQAAGQ